MSWKFIDPQTVNAQMFALSEVHAVKVKKFDGDGDVRNFGLKGWVTYADLLEIDPRTGKRLKKSEWFLFAAKGRREVYV